jgi:hypothetical protein
MIANEAKSIVGNKKVLDLFFHMIETTRSDISVAMSYFGSRWAGDEDVEQHYYKSFEDCIAHAVKNGARVKILGRPTKENEELQRKIRACGADVRLVDHGFLRFVVKDKEQCMIVSSEQYAENLHLYHAVWTSIPEFVRFFEKHFDDLWELC